MKIILEHQNSKTAVLSNDYYIIASKSSSLFPDKSHRPIQLFDPELTEYFEFTS